MEVPKDIWKMIINMSMDPIQRYIKDHDIPEKAVMQLLEYYRMLLEHSNEKKKSFTDPERGICPNCKRIYGESCDYDYILPSGNIPLPISVFCSTCNEYICEDCFVEVDPRYHKYDDNTCIKCLEAKK